MLRVAFFSYLQADQFLSRTGYIISLELTGSEPLPSQFNINVGNTKHQMHFFKVFCS